MNLVVDASIAVECLLRTRIGRHAAGIVDDAELAAPELLDAEVLAVLQCAVLAGRLRRDRASEAIEDLAHSSVERLSHRTLVRVAWSLRANVTAYDALYVAAARARGAALSTADGPLARAPGLGVVVRDVRLGWKRDPGAW